MAGALLIAMGWARLGAVIRFIPYPVTVGFTTGIALVIAVGQLPEALGLQLTGQEGEFLPRLVGYFEARATADWAAVALTGITVATVLYWPRVTQRVPGPLVALVFATGLAQLLGLGEMTDAELPGFDAEDVDLVLPPRTEVFEVAGSFFFGSAQRFSEVLSELHSRPRLVILRMRAVFALDTTGLHALEKVRERLKRHGTHLILSGVHAQPMDVLVRSGAYDRLGKDNVLGSFREAVGRAWELLDESPPTVAGSEVGNE